MRFVTCRGNSKSEQLINELERRGHQVLKLWPNYGDAPKGTMALFDDSRPEMGYIGCSQANLRLASHRLLKLAPSWTLGAVYLVGVRKLPSKDDFEQSIERLILLNHTDPTQMNLDLKAPWGSVPTDLENKLDYLLWRRDRVGDIGVQQKLEEVRFKLVELKARELQKREQMIESSRGGSLAWMVE